MLDLVALIVARALGSAHCSQPLEIVMATVFVMVIAVACAKVTVSARKAASLEILEIAA